MDTFKKHLPFFISFIGFSAHFSWGEIEIPTRFKGKRDWSTRYWCWRTNLISQATPSGQTPPFALSQRLWILEWPMNEKKSPPGTFWGVWLPWVRFPPPLAWLANWRFKDSPNLNMVVVLILVVTKKFTGGIILPKKDNYPTSPHVERRSLSHLNCWKSMWNLQEWWINKSVGLFHQLQFWLPVFLGILGVLNYDLPTPEAQWGQCV